MKNGAFVKWRNTNEYLTNYNGLQKGIDHGERNVIEEIDATESSINHIGFDYFSKLRCFFLYVCNDNNARILIVILILIG